MDIRPASNAAASPKIGNPEGCLLAGAWRRCSSVGEPCGYPSSSRLASRPPVNSAPIPHFVIGSKRLIWGERQFPSVSASRMLPVPGRKRQPQSERACETMFYRALLSPNSIGKKNLQQKFRRRPWQGKPCATNDRSRTRTLLRTRRLSTGQSATRAFVPGSSFPLRWDRSLSPARI